MTEQLSAALHELAESEPPHMLDTELTIRAGRSGLVRRRLAAVGGGTAVLAVTGLAMGSLAPFGGGAGNGGSTVGAGTPAGTAATTRADRADRTAPTAPMTPARPTRSPSALDTAPAPDPHDPAVTHWQFGYLPDGMAAYGGGGSALDSQGGTVWAYAPSGFRLQVSPVAAEPRLIQSADKAAPTAKIPATVAGAVKAFWMGYADGRILEHTDIVGDTAMLAWERPDGQWLQITVAHAEKQTDWQAQALKAAEGVVRQQRSVPMPVSLSKLPKDFEIMGGEVTRDSGNTLVELNFWTAKDHATAPVVMVVAFKTGSWKITDAVPPQNTNTCRDSNGLTVCVSALVPEPAPLTAVGGPQGLLNLITSFGNDPANWTTDVLP